jgi:DNA-binding NarL/FixJ family response regulator
VTDPDLAFLDLGPTGLAVWKQAALHPYATSAVLADLLGADPREVDRELQEQEERGLVRGVGGGWLAEDIVAWLDARHAAEQAEQEQRVAERARQRAVLLRSHLPRVHREGSRKLVEDDDSGERIPHRDVAERLVELVEHAEHSLRFMVGGSAPAGRTTRIVEALMGAAARGVRLSSVWTPALLQAARRTAAGEFPPLGSVRTSPDVPYRALLADDESVLVQRRPTDASQGALLITHRPTVALFARQIDALFVAGQRLAQSRDSGEEWSRQVHTRIVQLISEGATNRAISRAIHQSQRTTERIISDMMRHYHANNRVELVVKATALLTPAPGPT